MSKPLNILLLGGAKRVAMARLLIQAAMRRGLDPRIFSYELRPQVPIAAVATVIVGLKWSDPAIYAHLNRIVRQHNINIIIPFIDTMVGVAARFVSRYPELRVFAPVCTPELADTMFDKTRSATRFEECRLPVPPTYRTGRPIFPLIAKPRHGTRSRGIKVINTVAEFRRVVSPPGQYLLQQYIADCVEYTVDCYVGRDGTVCAVSPRERLEVMGGEVTHTIIVDDPELDQLARTTIQRLGLRGAVTVQALRDRETGRLMLMEVCPRLGGGAVCSVHGGADIPGMIIDEALGERPVPVDTLMHGTEILRYYSDVVFHNGTAVSLQRTVGSEQLAEEVSV